MVSASDAAFHARLTAYAAKNPRFAVGAAFARGETDPEVVVAGNCHYRASQPVTHDAAWHIGSITKSFTAALIMRLIAQGRLELDQPIGELLSPPEMPMHPDWRAITMGEALSHTAGLRANVPIIDLFKQEGDDRVAARLQRLQAIWHRAPGGRRGRFAYSNVGYVLAGAVAESIVGRPWEDLIVTELARPLGLTSLGFGPPTGEDAVFGHVRFLGFHSARDPAEKNADNPAWMGPAGGLRLSLGDLVRWGQAHLAAGQGRRPDFLTPDACALLHRPVSEEYGLGWVVQAVPEEGTTLIWHNGSNTMWYAVLALVPERDLVVAIAINRYDHAGGDALVKDLIKALLD
ncbi:MAG: serine hydrolase domain-containing protein [Pseudomonadota bacterium]